MMGRASALLFAIALLTMLAQADMVTRTFTNYYGSPPLGYVTTDLEANPSLIVPDYACVGTSVTPTLQVQTDWYSSVYDAKLKSNANLVSCLTSSSAVNQNQAISWLSLSSYACAFGPSTPTYFSTYAAFVSFMSGCGISNPLESIEKSNYYDTGGSVYPGFFKAGIGAYCNGTVSVNSTGSYNFGPVQYTGSAPVLPSLTSGSPADITLQAKFNTNSCGATSHAYVTSTCGGDSVYKHVNTTAPNFIALGAAKTIHFRNPFVCNLAALTFSPTSMNNSTTYSFNLVIKNNGDSVNITSIALVAGSPFSNFQVTNPPVPPSFTLGAGAQQTFIGSVKAPATVGMQTLTVLISSVSTAPSCNGTTANCNLQASFAINVTAPSNPANNTPKNCTLAFESHTSTFTPVDSAWVNATCRNSTTAVVPCGTLSWSTTAASGSMSPTPTTLPSRSQLTVNAVSAPQANAGVLAQQGANFSCTILLNVTAPDYIPLLSAPASVQVNTQFTATVTTKNIGAAANITTFTKLQFRSLTQPFSVAPLGQQGTQNNSFNFTCPATPALYELNATVDYTGLLTEGSENNNFATQMVNCTAAPPVIKPDYTSHINVPPTATVGTSFSVGVVTTNIGNGAANASSTTRLKISNQATPYNFGVRALAANGDSVTNTTTATCPSTPGYIYINASADFFNQINESNETNNNDTVAVNCVLPGNMPNYVPKITAPVVFINIPFIANFSTKNIGNAPGTVPSVTRVTFPGTVKDFSVIALPVNGEQNDSWDFVCTSPSAIMNETVDFYNVINESDENNTELKTISCNAVPDSCNLSFVGHSSTLLPYDSATVQATCYNGGVQTACPPFLWQQNAIGGSMNPANTIASWLPNSTLATFMAPSPQIGMKVNATSTLSGAPLYCELLFTVSDGTPIGPDYVVTSILPDHSPTGIGQVVQFTVTVLNQGNVNATNDSTSTATYSPGCEVITNRDSYFLPHIDAQASDISVNELACTCRVSGTQNITVTANPTHVQNETDFTNNARTQTFICQVAVQPITCAYFV